MRQQKYDSLFALAEQAGVKLSPVRMGSYLVFFVRDLDENFLNDAESFFEHELRQFLNELIERQKIKGEIHDNAKA